MKTITVDDVTGVNGDSRVNYGPCLVCSSPSSAVFFNTEDATDQEPGCAMHVKEALLALYKRMHEASREAGHKAMLSVAIKYNHNDKLTAMRVERISSLLSVNGGRS